MLCVVLNLLRMLKHQLKFRVIKFIICVQLIVYLKILLMYIGTDWNQHVFPLFHAQSISFAPIKFEIGVIDIRTGKVQIYSTFAGADDVFPRHDCLWHHFRGLL